jgi:hypothetical protein
VIDNVFSVTNFSLHKEALNVFLAAEQMGLESQFSIQE